MTYNIWKVCERMNHDWQPWYPKDERETFTWEKCARCGARRLTLK